MRRIVRWTIGNVDPCGYKCLEISIYHWRKLFGDKFETVVCYNGERPPVDCRTLDQRQYTKSLPPDPCGTAWKLYPPRLDINAQEIFIDNDLVLYNHPENLMRFLSEGGFFITEAWKRSYGYNDWLVPTGFTVNTGLFGLPPGFDFRKALLRDVTNWKTHFDEQGLVASVLAKQSVRIIPRSEIKVCVPEESFSPTPCGLHFVGLNQGYRDHFESFIRSRLLH